MSNAGKRLLDAAREMRSIARGEAKPARMHIPPDVDVRAIRKGLGLSQDAFAAEFFFSLSQIRDWEQHRSRPLDGNRAYLMMIEREPDAIRRILKDLQASMAKEDDSQPLTAAM